MRIVIDTKVIKDAVLDTSLRTVVNGTIKVSESSLRATKSIIGRINPFRPKVSCRTSEESIRKALDSIDVESVVTK